MRILAEPIWKGGSAAEVRRLTRLESLLNIALASWPVRLLCASDRRIVPPRIIRQIPATHPQALTSEGIRGGSTQFDPAGFILEPGH